MTKKNRSFSVLRSIVALLTERNFSELIIILNLHLIGELRIITVQRANRLMSHIHKVPGILSKSGNKNINIISTNLESQISKYSIC